MSEKKQEQLLTIEIDKSIHIEALWLKLLELMKNKQKFDFKVTHCVNKSLVAATIQFLPSFGKLYLDPALPLKEAQYIVSFLMPERALVLDHQSLEFVFAIIEKMPHRTVLYLDKPLADSEKTVLDVFEKLPPGVKYCAAREDFSPEKLAADLKARGKGPVYLASTQGFFRYDLPNHKVVLSSIKLLKRLSKESTDKSLRHAITLFYTQLFDIFLDTELGLVSDKKQLIQRLFQCADALGDQTKVRVSLSVDTTDIMAELASLAKAGETYYTKLSESAVSQEASLHRAKEDRRPSCCLS